MPLSISNLNPFGRKAEPVEQLDKDVIQIDESVDLSAPEVEATVTHKEKSKFEWNVEKLFVHNPEHSMGRTWAVRILAFFITIPTLLLDLGRRLAFSAGLVSGKSWSLIDKTKEGCKALSSKVNAIYQSHMHPKLTIEQLNEISKKNIESYAKKLVNGYRDLNGGFFHTNSSFSSPYALKAEAKIRDAQEALVYEINQFIGRNVSNPEDFTSQVELAKKMIQEAISNASGKDLFVEDKTFRFAAPSKMSDVAFRDFLAAFSKLNVLAQQLIDISTKSSNFVAGLKKGVEAGILTKDQATEALETQTESVYLQGLETGVEEAEKQVKDLLSKAIQERIVTQGNAAQISDGIQPDVEVLAKAASRDVLRARVPAVDVPIRLIKISEDLRKSNRLSDEDDSTFLTAAEDHISNARQEVEAENLRAREEADRAEAEKIAQEKKVADQQALFGQFDGMLGLISHKQAEMTAQFSRYDQMVVDFKAINEELEGIQNTKVKIRDKEINVLQAADEYYKARSQISKSDLTPLEREEQYKALADEGFTKGTIDKIQELKALEPKLTQIINAQATLSREIDSNHGDLAKLLAVYKVFRKNNFSQLETDNRKASVSREVLINKTQKTLNDRHAQIVGKNGLLARIRFDQPSISVNVDPSENRKEVAALIQEFERANSPKSTEPFYKRWYQAAIYPIRWIRG